MKYYLPNSVGSRDVSSLFVLSGQLISCEDEVIELDGSRVEFVDPQGLVVLGALLSNICKKKRVFLLWLPTHVAGYLARMNFFEHCPVEGVEIPDWERSDLRSRLVELTCVDSHANSDAVADRLADAITGTLTDADPDAPYDVSTGKNKFDRFRYPIWYSLSELIENSLTHARQKGNLSASVWVAAQYYEKSGIVKMAVADNGCGMLATLQNHPELKERTHLSAIRTALIPKVSCNRDGMLYNTQGNQGVGLTTTARIARAARGWLIIASGDSFAHSHNSRVGGVLPGGGYWRGVSIGFHCRRSDLPAVRIGQLLPPGPPSVPLAFVD